MDVNKHTDELRKAARKTEGANGRCEDLYRGDLEIIANHIDAAHQRELREQYTKGYDDGFDAGYASADDWDVDHADELAEHGWVELPKDADGVPIRVGDVIMHVPDGTNGLAPETVKHIVLSKDEQRIVTEDCSYSVPKYLRHYKPTVEDVLREFGKAWVEWEDGSPFDPIAKYADRIREAAKHEEDK